MPANGRWDLIRRVKVKRKELKAELQTSVADVTFVFTDSRKEDGRFGEISEKLVMQTKRTTFSLTVCDSSIST